MTNVQAVINGLFKSAIRLAYPGMAEGPGTVVQALSDLKFGDYKCPASMSLAQVGMIAAAW